MSPLVARRRRRGVEYLDDRALDAALRTRSLADVSCANRWLGGTHAALAELRGALPALRGRRDATLLDVGTGLGDLAARLRDAAARRGARLTPIGVDAAPALAAESRARLGLAICGDALRLPIGDGAVDVALCSQLLHHFDHAEAVRLIRELDRVARSRVIVSDLRRSAVAAVGLWLASFPLRFHPYSRHDGVLSVLRGFTASELSDLVHEATGVRPAVRRRLGWRLTASWLPTAGPARAPFALGPLPDGRRMRTVDERVVRAPVETIFALAADVERWPEHLAHYRYVRFRERDGRGGGVVEMSANRPFGPIPWPTFWTSEMAVAPAGDQADRPWVRFHHVRGVTTGMDVEWSFREVAGSTHVTIVHVWNGPRWPFIGGAAATAVIGPIFVHGIASRTLAGLAAAAERQARSPPAGR